MNIPETHRAIVLAALHNLEIDLTGGDEAAPDVARQFHYHAGTELTKAEVEAEIAAGERAFTPATAETPELVAPSAFVEVPV